MATIDGTSGSETLRGTLGDDIINGYEGNDSLYGEDGADTLNGGEGSDYLYGGLGADTLNGGAGNDSLYGEAGDDVLNGGEGDDWLSDWQGTNIFNGGNGSDTIQASSLGTVDAGADNDTIYIGGSNVTITTGTGSDTIRPGSYWYTHVITDFTAGDAGDLFDLKQLLTNLPSYPGGNPFATGHVRLVQSGADTLFQVDYDGAAATYGWTTTATFQNVTATGLTAFNFGGYGPDGSAVAGLTIDGTSAGETLTGTLGDDIINGYEGNDKLYGEDGADTLNGGDGSDNLYGGLGADTLNGGADGDQLLGGASNDVLNGDAGNDYLMGEAGDDVLNGGDGDDYFYDWNGTNTLNGGNGSDTILAYSTATIDAGADNDTIYVGSSNLTITTGTGSDKIRPGSHWNTYVITDFTAGHGGDIFDLKQLLSYLPSYPGGNPFATGHVRLVQSGADTLFQVDYDGAGTSYGWTTTATVQNVTATELTAFNFGGYGPDGSIETTPSAVPDSASGDEDTVLSGQVSAIDPDSTTVTFAVVDGPSNGTLTFNSNGTWSYTPDANFHGTDSFTFTASDESETSSPATVTLTINSVNDAPAVGLADSTVNGTEDSDLVFSAANGNAITLSDPEASELTVTLEVANGTLTLSQTTGLTITAGANGSATMSFTGSVSAINVALEGLTYRGTLNYEGSETLTVTTGDGEATTIATVAITLADDGVTDGTPGDDNLVGTGGNEGINGYGGNDLLTGHAGDDALSGGTGNDRLDGGEGNDTLDGGDGWDWAVYLSSGAGVTVDLNITTAQDTLGAGSDTLTNIECLAGSEFADRITGDAGNNRLYGYGGNDVLVGGAGNDRLDGGAGGDDMAGGEGNDAYIVDDAGDLITEAAGQGTDRVWSSVSHALADNVEWLWLTGTAAINGTGNALNNVITANRGANKLDGGDGDDRLYGMGGDDVLIGGLGNDRLDGGSGIDNMAGGAGNDIYVVHNAGDLVTEADGEGTADFVRAAVTYTLTDHVERLMLIGPATIDGTGNALNNWMRGNAASNRLDGGAGDDRLFGVLGDDTLVGGLGNDWLNGGAGADSMAGGEGNDGYHVDDAADVVSEAGGQGTDRVWASISYALTADVERLTLTGSAAIDGTGNALANVIHGNAAANRLDGGAGDDILYGMGGDDTLIGGTGNDRLIGGAGLDAFLFDTALDGSTNVDTIIDFTVADDTIQLHQSVFAALALGTLSADAFASGTAAQDADDRIIYDSGTGRIYYDADGNGAGEQVLFATVTAGTALTSADFLIVG